ncbi:macro domain-containing protein [Knoellia sp. CPCC 206435]|uniref:macro domain-containing protein n=1 Tax=Knoellia terrae TaxID=3404797 RepID=UPI003B435CE9
MAAYTEATGDLLTLGLPAIGHGCNTAGSMAGGIARQVQERWPQLHSEYAQLCRDRQFPLGSFHVVDVGEVLVYNVATQRNPGQDAYLGAISSAVAGALQDLECRGITTLGLPRLGAGIGGLQWSAVQAVLRALAASSPVDLVVVTQPRRPIDA